MNDVKNNLRTCGECQACCYATRIDELKKPAFQRCELQCDTGCSKYDGRPDECRNYKCTWLIGFSGADARPDKLGVMFTSRSHPQLGPWISAHVTDRQALEGDLFKQELSKLTERCTVIEILKDEMFVMGGPVEQIKMFLEYTAKDLVPVRNLIPVNALVRRA
jgi:hypothetical protein